MMIRFSMICGLLLTVFSGWQGLEAKYIRITKTICKAHGGDYQRDGSCLCINSNISIKRFSPTHHCGALDTAALKRAPIGDHFSRNYMCQPSRYCGQRGNYNEKMIAFELANAAFKSSVVKVHYDLSSKIMSEFGFENCWDLVDGSPEWRQCQQMVQLALGKYWGTCYGRAAQNQWERAQRAMISFLSSKYFEDLAVKTEKQKKFIDIFIGRVKNAKVRIFRSGRPLVFMMQTVDDTVYVKGSIALLRQGLSENFFMILLHELGHLGDFQTRIVGENHFRPLDNPFTQVMYDIKEAIERDSDYRIEDGHYNETVAEIISMAAYLYQYRKTIEKLAPAFFIESLANYCASVLWPERSPSYADSRVIFDYLLAGNSFYKKAFCKDREIATLHPLWSD